MLKNQSTSKPSKFFTPTEWFILDHRLEIADCIAECLGNGQGASTYEEQDRHIAGFMDDFNNCFDVTFRSIDDANSTTVLFIKDAIEGSTFLPDEGAEFWCKLEEGKNKYYAYKRAMRSIEAKTGWMFP